MTDWLTDASDRVLDAVLRSCGGSRMLQIAAGVDSLVPRLLDEGVDAYALLDDAPSTIRAERRAPGRHRTGTLSAGLPWPDRHFDVVMSTGALESLDAAEIPAALAELLRVSRGAVFLVIGSPNPDLPPEAATRDWWEERAFAAGLRRHPCAQRAVPYSDLDREDSLPMLSFERVPDAVPPVAATDGVAEDREAEDWLRRTGSDAEIRAAFYHLAADILAARQTVVVTMDGAGSGAAILARRSEAARLVVPTGDAAGATARYGMTDPRLAFIPPDRTEPDGRADLVTAIQDTPPDIAGLIRWLRPGGRLMVAVPAGLWPEVAAAFGDELALDRRFLLRAAIGDRALDEQSLDDPLEPADGDWCAAMAVRSPFAPVDPAERAERVAAERHHVRAWWRDYDNPRLVEVLVNQGGRVRNPALLAAWTDRALREARPGSADQGAMLCVRAYRLLEDDAASWEEMAAHLARIDAYLGDADATMHALRWRVSLLYAAGLLHQRGGQLRAALDRFAACGETDISAFSATLGTKTVSALLKAGRLALALDGPAEGADGGPERAGHLWRRGMAEARRLLQGDWSNVWGDIDDPFWVETRETAEMVDLAMDCANALASLPALTTHPGLLREKLVWGRAGMAGNLFRLEKEILRQRAELRTERNDRAIERHNSTTELTGRTIETALWRGAAFLASGHTAGAERALADIRARDPVDTERRLVHTLLVAGALTAGWKADQQLRQSARPDRAPAGLLPWQGGAEETADRRLLVWRDGGLGEELMFSSCLPDLVAREVAVTLECEPRLTGLFARSFPSIRVVPAPPAFDSPAPPDCGRHVALTALPGFLRTSLDDFPEDGGGWLTAEPARAALWRERLAALGPGMTIGLCWRGGATGATALSRLEQWEPLLGLAGHHIVSLQYAPDEEEMTAAERAFRRPIHRWPDLDLTRDLEGLAALIAGLDLVISVSTMVADLAGALGRPVWRCGTGDDWATLGTDRRPWYPTMRLFQVKADQPLDAAIEAIGQELAGRTDGSDQPAGDGARAMNGPASQLAQTE